MSIKTLVFELIKERLAWFAWRHCRRRTSDAHLCNLEYCPNDDIDFEKLKQCMTVEGVYIVDVRQRFEIRKMGRMPNSVHIPLKVLEHSFTNMTDEDFVKNYGRPKPFMDSCIVVMCSTGRRSILALILLKNLGYTNVKNYKGGYKDWLDRKDML